MKNSIIATRQTAAGAAVLAVAWSLLASACTASDKNYGGAVSVAVSVEPTGLNPLLDRGPASNVNQLIYSSLVKPSEALDYQPDAAESWSVSDDGLVWEFRLRDDIVFHDGAPLTADDVAFTLEEVLRGDRSYSVSPLFRVITRVEAVSDRLVRLTLAEPFAPILSLLTIEILPAHILSETGTMSMEEFRWNPVGSGPFLFDSWNGVDTMRLKANPDYFEGRPYLDSIEIVSFPSKTAAWSALMQGKVDVVLDLNREDYEIIRDDDRFAAHGYLDYFYYTILLNLASPLFADAELREAVDISIDRSELIDTTLGGLAVPTTGPFRPETWPYDESVAVPGYEPGRAAEILKELGYEDTDGDSVLDRDGEALAFTLLVDEGDDLKRDVAQRIKWQLFLVGIRVDVEYLPADELVGRRLYPGDYDAALLQFNAGGDPDTFTYLFWHSDQIGSSNLARYANERVDELIVAGRRESDRERREAIYHEIHRVIAAERPAVFLFVRKIFIGASARVEGVEANPNVFFETADEWVVE